MLLSCKGRAGLVVNVTTIIPQTDKAFRVSLAIKLRVLDRLLNIDARLSWVVNCAHLTLCAAAQHIPEGPVAAYRSGPRCEETNVPPIAAKHHNIILSPVADVKDISGLR